ncbi:MAG: LUD domain-containing protein [Myxococcota bacterium]|nr:LUD domain-containing protein [Myxococcota bacterium]
MSVGGVRRPGGSRLRVLAALRATSPQPVALPDVDSWSATRAQKSPEERADAFISALEEADASVVRVTSEAEIEAVLEAHAPYQRARRVVSGITGIGPRGEGGAGSELPESFADVDVAVARGHFGVAENGAVWCDGEGLPHRVTYFLCQHLVLVVAAATLVDTLHDAYRQLGEQPVLCRERAWSGFIAGPSKTADIEQALVVGAHGPRSLLVVLVD